MAPSRRQTRFMTKRETTKKDSRKMRSSKRALRGARRYVRREFSFRMRTKIRYRTDLQPLFIAYVFIMFIIISLVAVIYGNYSSVPWIYYFIAVFGGVAVEIYILGGKRFDP